MASGLALVIAACTGADPGPDDGLCTSDRACELSRLISEVTVAPGEEISGLCQSWTLDNPTELWVTTVEMENDGAYHHSNWFFVPDSLYPAADGAWDCDEQGFQELAAAVAGGYVFAQSTQSTSESQVFPAGAAVRIPPYSRIVGSTHLLNASDQPITTNLNLRVHTAAEADVEVKLVPARISYFDLDIAPQADSAFTAECDIATTYADSIGEPFEYTLFHALPHYHELGVFFEMELMGGPRDGELLFRHDGYGENFGQIFDPPLDLAATGATGLRFTCGFSNPRTESVGWGIGDQEMCVTALFAGTNMAFEGAVNFGEGTEIGVDADGVIRHRGACTMLGLPWDHDKPGGPPR
jgi:hypothetical protein